MTVARMAAENSLLWDSIANNRADDVVSIMRCELFGRKKTNVLRQSGLPYVVPSRGCTKQRTNQYSRTLPESAASYSCSVFAACQRLRTRLDYQYRANYHSITQIIYEIEHEAGFSRLLCPRGRHLGRWCWFKGQLHQVSPRRTFRLPC